MIEQPGTSCAVCQRVGVMHCAFIPLEWRGMKLRVNFWLCAAHQVDILKPDYGTDAQAAGREEYKRVTAIVQPIGECPVPDCPGKLYPYGDNVKCDGRGHVFPPSAAYDDHSFDRSVPGEGEPK